MTDFDQSIFDDPNKFQNFIDTDQHIRLINRWEYAGKTNNHSEFSTFIKDLQKVSSRLSTINETTKVLPFYNEFLTPNNLKLVYRCLNHQKEGITVAMLKLLTQLIETVSINNFVNTFNLELSFFHKLVSNNDNIRKHFITFWISTLSKLSFLDRKNYLGSKVWVKLFKSLNKDDQAIQFQVLKFIEIKVLGEQNFNKFTKLKFLNETVLFNLQISVDTPEYLDIFHKIVDPKYGILFQEQPNSQVSINGTSFKINNKVLYNLLSFIKIESTNKIKLVELILSKDTNLIEPYSAFLSLNYGNDLVSNFQYAFLFTKILSIPNYKLSSGFLKTLNKNSLSKNIVSDGFAQYTSLEILYLIVSKLPRLKPLEVKAVLDNIPSIAEILHVNGNKIVNLLVLKILSKMSLYSELNTSLLKFVNSSLDNMQDLEGINFNRFNHLVTTRLNLNSRFQTKSNNFSQIIKFSNMDTNHWFFYEIINRLVYIESENTVNPLWAFIYLKYPEELFPLLKELTTRLNNPYKYIDMPFKAHLVVKIFLEQFSIYRVKSNATTHDDWFNIMVSNFILLGEEQSEVLKLLTHFKLSVKLTTELPYNNTIGELSMNKGNITNKFIMNDFDLICVLENLGRDPKLYFEKVSKYIAERHVNNFRLFQKFLVSKETIGLFSELLQELNLRITNNDITAFIFESLKVDDKLIELNWLLDESQLNHPFKESIQLANYKLLLSKSIIPEVSLEALFKLKSSDKLPIIKSKLTSDNLSQYIGKITKKRYFTLLEGLELTDEVIDILKKETREVCCYLTCSNPKTSELFEDIPLDKLKKTVQPNLYWKLLENCSKWNPSLLTQKQIETFYKSLNINDVFKPEVVRLAVQFPQANWMRNCLIQITKVFAERTLEKFPIDFDGFLLEVTKLFPINEPDIIDTQLEVILSSDYVGEYSYLAYANSLVLTSKVNSGRLLQIFLNNTKNVLHGSTKNEICHSRIESSLLIYNLFHMDANANVHILKQILPLYCGSMRFEDLILKQILIAIESISNINWLSMIKNWEITQFDTNDIDLVGGQTLIQEDMVSLDKTFINNALKADVDLALPYNKNLKLNYKSVVRYVDDNLFKISYEYISTIYDHEFLMLLVINNEEFFKINEKVVVNYKNLIDHGFLELFIKNYNLSDITSVILSALVKYIDTDEYFKDKSLFKVYLSNLVHTFKSHKLTNIQLKIYSSFIPILANPGHYLYEITYKYVLGHPIIKPEELPNFNTIKHDSLKTIEWYIVNLQLSKEEDLALLNKNKIMEWLFNLLNIKILPPSLQLGIERVLFRLPELNGGTTTLVTKYGALGFVDQINNSVLAPKLEISSTKRLMDWTNQDYFNQIKRIKN